MVEVSYCHKLGPHLLLLFSCNSILSTIFSLILPVNWGLGREIGIYWHSRLWPGSQDAIGRIIGPWNPLRQHRTAPKQQEGGAENNILKNFVLRDEMSVYEHLTGRLLNNQINGMKTWLLCLFNKYYLYLLYAWCGWLRVLNISTSSCCPSPS